MNPMKLILLAVGGYFLIKATGLSLPGFGPSSVEPDGGSTTGGGAPPSTGNAAPPASTLAPLDEATKTALIKLAASGDAAAAKASADRGIKLGADAWNWYREQATGVVTTADLFTEGNRGELIDAPEYLRRRTAASLSGLAALVAGVRNGY